MPKDFSRVRRVAEQIQRELAELIQQELKDPRIGFVTLTDVEVTSDYTQAKVFFTALGDSKQVAQTQEALQHAGGFLRKELGHRMQLRVIPQISFVHDVSVERGMRLSQLIDQALNDHPVSDAAAPGAGEPD